MKITVNGVKALNGHHFDIEMGDLMIFYGPNNAGKSSVILGAAQYFDLNKDLEINSDYLSIDRLRVSGEINADRFERIEDQNTMVRKSYSTGSSEITGPDGIKELSLQDEETREKIIAWFNANFEEIEIDEVRLNKLQGIPRITIGDNNPILQGSGSRAILSIVIQLFNPLVNVLCIDEPELSLEPKAQKKLFELIKNAAYGLNEMPKKNILIATHSHLFLDRETLTNNYEVKKIDNIVTVGQITDEKQLQDGIYNLLGSDPTDLFFPGNIVVVEGRSDSIFLKSILEKMIDKNICEKKKVVFHFLDGYDSALVGAHAIVQMLKTQSYFPIYKDRICGLFDKPSQNEKLVNDIRTFIGDTELNRFILLEKDAIEYYYPVSIIAKVFDNPTLTPEKYALEVNAFLEHAKSHKGKGKLFGKIISKVDLALRVVDEFRTEDYALSLIDENIINLLKKSTELSF